MSRALTLLLPGLAGPVPGLDTLPEDEWPPLPGWRTLLSRAVPHAGGVEGREAILFELFGVSAHEPQPPVAAVTRILDGGMPDDAWWMRADPVCLHADPDRVVMASAAAELDMDDARALAAGLVPHLAEDGLRLEVLAPQRWYLRADPPPRLYTHPPEQAVGSDIGPLLPSGPDGAHWRRLLNELQMLLHASAVNEARETRGRAPVNSLWFWGGGRVPPVGPRRWDRVWAEDVLGRALALHAGVACAPPPEAPAAWLAGLENGRHLLVLDRLGRARRDRDPFAWLAGMAELERDWAAPLAEALRRGRLDSLEVRDDGGQAWRLTRAGLRRWWRRRRPFQAFLRG